MHAMGKRRNAERKRNVAYNWEKERTLAIRAIPMTIIVLRSKSIKYYNRIDLFTHLKSDMSQIWLAVDKVEPSVMEWRGNHRNIDDNSP